MRQDRTTGPMSSHKSRGPEKKNMTRCDEMRWMRGEREPCVLPLPSLAASALRVGLIGFGRDGGCRYRDELFAYLDACCIVFPFGWIKVMR